MTWSLKIEGGDLSKGRGNSLQSITGSDKVQQDLRHWILSNLGEDPLTPNFGSIIDFDEETFVNREVDTLFVPANRLDLIIEEIDRIIEEYQRNQFVRIQKETLKYNGRHTFSSGEIIQDYGIEYEQIYDTLYIDINLTLLSGAETTVGFDIKGVTE